MTFTTLMLLFFAAYGMTYMLCDAEIFDFIRSFATKARIVNDFLDCYFCVGFWAGLAVGLPWFFVVQQHSYDSVVTTILVVIIQTGVFSFAAGGFCHVLQETMATRRTQ